MQVLFHGVGHYDPRSRPIGPAVWPHYDVIVILQGEITLRLEEQEVRLREEDAVIIPPRHHFVGQAISESAIIWVFHYLDFPGGEASPILSPSPVVIRKAAARSLVRKVMDEVTQGWQAVEGGGAPRNAELLGEWLLAQFERVALEQPSGEPARVRDALAHVLDGNFHLEVADVARLSGYCASRFRKIFTEYYKVSPQRYLLRVRIEEAKRLLQGTSLPIKEIASRLGYSEVAAFHRAFQRETALSPALWRRQHGGPVF